MLSPNLTDAAAGLMRTPAIVNGVAVLTEPRAVVTVISPVVAAPGTVTIRREAVILTIAAEAPLKETAVTPEPKPIPTMVT